jgi:hypothetical protein
MPEIEELIDAIIKGTLSDEEFEALPKIELHAARHTILQALIPALPVLEKMKAAAWEEGSEARDKYVRDAWLSDEAGIFEAPKNPYGEAI